MNDGFNITRHFDDYPPEWAHAVVLLIDALRDYVRSNAEMDRDAAIEGWDITPEQWRKHALHMQTIKLLLKELEEYGTWCVENIK